MRRKKKNLWGMVLAAGILAFGGCGEQPEEGNVVMLEQQREEIVYDLAVAIMGDVEKTLSIRCHYRQEKEEEISFSLSGKRIENVYVKEGAHVEKGQILAQLSGGSLETEMERLEYQIARNKLLLGYSLENENDQISGMWLNYLFGYDTSEAAAQAIKRSVEVLQQNGTYAREDYQDSIALDELELGRLKDELEQSRVYAGMSGTVSYLQEGLEGSTSVKGEKIMTIIDSSKCLFVTEKEEYIPYFTEGMELQITITSGTGAGSYTVVPYEMEKWGEKQTFKMAYDNTESIIEVGAMGTMKLVTDRRENVLNIPKSAVHTAGEKTYVYVLGENGMREIKWIETGLYGDRNVEVLSGLTRGEKVVD